ncbi:CBS domain-containing protein [Pelistega sp. MC2]|uniref:CBS domain-containing protein n=1 Tax=Pelistega sp. MC2 TaxID=1720297 RepID=UPI0008D93CB3|nr:CBS domain-containing protein [Pelistega sp. MC2]
MDIAQEFLQTFNRLESYLNQLVEGDGHYPFYTLIDKVKSRQIFIARHESFLKYMANIRNLIVHDEYYPKRIVLTPDASIVDKFKSITQQIISAPKAIDIASKDLKVYGLNTLLIDVLQYIKERDYSQIIIQKDDGQYGLLTRKTISRWVERNIHDGTVNLKNIKLTQVVSLEKKQETAYIAAQKNIYEVASLFADQQKRIQAIIVTQDGQASSQPMGLISFWDVSRAIVGEG